MNVRLYMDETMRLPLGEIAANLARLTPKFRFTQGQSKFAIPHSLVTYPRTFHTLDKHIDEESAADQVALLFTEKPYDDNFFWHTEGKKVILSFFGWDQLTNLSRNNGAVYFICSILVRVLNIGDIHEENVGCVNDFWWDKGGVDTGMRRASICHDCLRDFRSKPADGRTDVLGGIQTVLVDLGAASRGDMDICEFWSLRTEGDVFDVFMCHNSQEKDDVREINGLLRTHGVKTWFDEEQIPPGRLWQQLLEEQIEKIKAAAVFVGQTGTGPWQEVELRAFLTEFTRRRCPIIPIILPKCTAVPMLPLFLRQFTWVDFRKAEPDPFKKLLWGITGKKQ